MSILRQLPALSQNSTRPESGARHYGRERHDEDVGAGEAPGQGRPPRALEEADVDPLGGPAEYTVLLGVLLVAVIGTIGLVGNWVSTKWTALACSLSNAGSC